MLKTQVFHIRGGNLGPWAFFDFKKKKGWVFFKGKKNSHEFWLATPILGKTKRDLLFLSGGFGLREKK